LRLLVVKPRHYQKGKRKRSKKAVHKMKNVLDCRIVGKAMVQKYVDNDSVSSSSPDDPGVYQFLNLCTNYGVLHVVLQRARVALRLL